MVEGGAFERGSDDVVMLGGELAAARVAEQRRVPTGPSPIADVHYVQGSGDRWRWVEQPVQDAAMSAFVAAYAAADPAVQAASRGSLAIDDLYTVLLFAQRRAFAAIRTGDPNAVAEAFDALSAVDVERVDYRDVFHAGWLAGYAASRAGVPAATAAWAVARAGPRVAEILLTVLGSGDIDLAECCGYRVVATPDGPVLFEDEGESYASDRDLVPTVLGLAAAVEADGTYRVTDLGVGVELPSIWVGAGQNKRIGVALERLTGCASIHGLPVTAPGPDPAGHFLLGYLAETAKARDAAVLARAAQRGSRPGSVTVGVAVRRLCAIFIASCAHAGQPSFENAATMARFQSAMSTLLA